jgi:DNA-binding response OmpR family regulator
MNEPPPDEKGIENVIDIFILSSDEKVALQVMEHLAQRDYRITVFTSSDELKQTLYSGKPNLLICDSTTEAQEGFEVCRYIKADNELWVIPVLLLTSASTLRDLLNTLDSNADNFIAQPYYLPYFLLLVEGMLATPVERQTPDQIKTQFKISHDDRTYVVAASRRKLLEYLLSAFEVAVNKSSELVQVNTDLKAILEQVKDLERSVTNHANVIQVLNTTINEKEQKIAALVRVSEEQSNALAQKNEEIENLLIEQNEDKTLIAAREETIRSMARDQEDERAGNRSKTETFTRRISALEDESVSLRANIETLQNALKDETNRSTSQEKTLCALTLEYEQQKGALEAEKKRADSAEQEIVAVMRAKTESEQDLTRVITELNTTETKQAADLQSLKDEIDNLNQQLEKLQENLSTTTAALDNESGILKLQKERFEELLGEKEKTDRQLESVLQELKEVKDSVESGEQKRISLASNLGEVIADKEKSEQTTKSLLASLETAKAEIEFEREKRRAIEETLEKTTKERDNALEMLRHEYDTIQSDLDANKMTLAERERNLESTVAIREALENELNEIKAKNNALEEELSLASQYRTQSGQQSRTLSDELEQVKAALETERRLRRIAEEKAKGAAQQQENLEQNLRRTYDEMERAKKERDATLWRFKDELETASHQISALEEKISALEREKPAPGEVRREGSDEQKVNLVPVVQPETQLPVIIEPVSQSLAVESPSQPQSSSTSPKDVSSSEISKETLRVFSGVIQKVPEISGADDIFLEHTPEPEGGAPSTTTNAADEHAVLDSPEPSLEKLSGEDEEKEPFALTDEAQPEQEDEEEPEEDEEKEPSDLIDEAQPEQEDEEEPEEDEEKAEYEGSDESTYEAEGQVPQSGLSFNRNQWMDLLKWAHHSGALTQDQRLKIVRMGRLIQKDRKLTKKQQEQISEIIAFVYALGYRPPVK